MNYRHAFHAGNFADVVKHATLTRILLHLCAKAAPFRVIDTHAGSGRYDLAGEEARRSGEWREGIGRLLAVRPGPLLAPYVDAVAACNKRELTVYPGSPLLVRAFLRNGDRLTACELEPSATSALSTMLKVDPRCKVIAIDGWLALNAYVPPKERRGLVLIDPPFEEASDFARIGAGLEAAHRKWSSGIYQAWYPLKGRQGADALARHLRRSGIPRILRAELTLVRPAMPERLSACGLIIINPPFTLEGELRTILRELVCVLGPRGSYGVDWLAREA